MQVSVDSFRLRFPLDIEASGLVLRMSGEQTVKAAGIDASISILPLLKGEASIPHASLHDASMIMGGPDSAMFMTINADTLNLCDVSIALATMDINLCRGRVAHGGVNLTLNPVPSPVDTATAEPTEMKVRLGTMVLDDFTFNMAMLPTIDSLSAVIPSATLHDGLIDLEAQTIALGTFTGRGLDAAYIAPDSATVAATPVIESTPSTSLPWTITIDSIGFSGSRALYTTAGVVPAPGLDFTFINVENLDLSVTRFFNRAERVVVPLTVSGRERCGVQLTAAGTLNIDSVGTGLQNFRVSTANNTSLKFNALLGMGDMTTDPLVPINLDLNGYIATADGRLMFPAFKPYMAAMPRDSRIFAQADIKGTAGNLAVNDIALAIAGQVKLRAKGRIENAFDPARIGGNLALSGALIDLNPLKNILLDKTTAKEINIPRTTLKGNMAIHNGNLDGYLDAITGEGKINLAAKWNSRGEDYDVTLATVHFPVNAFLPSMGIGMVTADVTANGHGYDPFKPDMRLDASLDVTQAIYNGYDFSGISGTASIHGGIGSANLHSTNPAALFDLSATGNLDGETYIWNADLSGLHADLFAMHLSPAETTVDGALSAVASFSPASNTIAAKVNLNTLTYTDSVGSFTIDNVLAHLNANDSVTNASIHNRDFYAFFSSNVPIDTITTRFGAIGPIIDDEIARRLIDVERLQHALPPFTLDVNAGNNNAITDILADSKMGFKYLSMTAVNDSSLTFDANVLGFHTETIKTDTLTFDLAQYGPRLIYAARINNRPGTFDEWAHVNIDGYLADNRLGFTLAQRNIAGKEGYNVGLATELNDSSIIVNFEPTDPTIAYQPWTINEDNFIKYSFTHKHIDANLHMHGAGSSLAIYTDHIEGQDDRQEELVVEISDINIADWVNLNPFAPPMDGQLSANLKVSGDGGDVVGNGFITLSDFSYDRQRVGTIGADLDVSTDLNGRIRANADISIDSVRTITIAGALNDSTAGSPLALDFSMIHFPLSAVNPFLPRGMASLTGTLNGRMDITGTGNEPLFDGWLRFDSTEVKVDMIGTTYPVSDVEIPVSDNIVTFNNFAISGVNRTPLALNGTVDLRSISQPVIDLSLTSANFQICDTQKAARGADIYGKGFLDIDATVKGNMDFMRVGANISILAGTNLTYVMSDAEAAIQSRSAAEVVKFVNLSDTAAVAAADSITGSSLAMMIQATLNINNGSTLNVDLSSDGHNKVRIMPEGTVNFSMMPFSDARVTGRININSGFARYTPPFMSEKLFNFNEGSYVAFNGDMLDPILNIKAVDVIKANVTQTGQNSRLINFDVTLAVTGTLNNMNVVFDLATDDDATVANELSSMSAEQRANQAMNMLLYNIYTGPGTTGNANLSGNALYSFLTSQLNSWAARTIKGVDLSFGVDQYDRTYNGSTSTTTSYSYQVSKSLFNDRFKIVVGGNYSSDADADENFSQNLIKDISFEYFLNDARTMYLRLFRHTGYESILEGEITRTGVGFVYRRKLTSLRNIFARKPKQIIPATPDNSVSKPLNTRESDENK